MAVFSVSGPPARPVLAGQRPRRDTSMVSFFPRLRRIRADSFCRMSDETARVEDVLLEKSAADKMIQAFVQASGVSFEGILDP